MLVRVGGWSSHSMRGGGHTGGRAGAQGEVDMWEAGQEREGRWDSWEAGRVRAAAKLNFMIFFVVLGLTKPFFVYATGCLCL